MTEPAPSEYAAPLAMAADPGSNIRCSDICLTVTRSLEPLDDPVDVMPGRALPRDVVGTMGSARCTTSSAVRAGGD